MRGKKKKVRAYWSRLRKRNPIPVLIGGKKGGVLAITFGVKGVVGFTLLTGERDGAVAVAKGKREKRGKSLQKKQ